MTELQRNVTLKTCYRDDLTVSISCTNLLSIYLDYQLNYLLLLPCLWWIKIIEK